MLNESLDIWCYCVCRVCHSAKKVIVAISETFHWWSKPQLPRQCDDQSKPLFKNCVIAINCISLILLRLVGRASLHSLLQIEPTWRTNFRNMFFAFLYMFRVTTCPSSGENTVPMRHLVFVTVYRWLTGMQGGIALHTSQSSMYSDKYQVSHRYGSFFWWWNRPAYQTVIYIEWQIPGVP